MATQLIDVDGTPTLIADWVPGAAYRVQGIGVPDVYLATVASSAAAPAATDQNRRYLNRGSEREVRSLPGEVAYVWCEAGKQSAITIERLEPPIGPYRDKQTITIGSDDYENDAGFTCQAGSAGNITYRTLNGANDETESGLMAGESIVGPGNVPVILRAVRGTSTVTSIVVGIL